MLNNVFKSKHKVPLDSHLKFSTCNSELLIVLTSKQCLSNSLSITNLWIFQLKALVNIVVDRLKKVELLADLYNYVQMDE